MATEWVWMQTGIPPKCKLTKWRKESLKAVADELVRDFYQPTFIKPPLKDQRFNYIVDFSTKWHGLKSEVRDGGRLKASTQCGGRREPGLPPLRFVASGYARAR